MACLLIATSKLAALLQKRWWQGYSDLSQRKRNGYRVQQINRVHAIAWQALSKLSAAEDIRITSVCSGFTSFNWLQNQPDLLASIRIERAIQIQTCQAGSSSTTGRRSLTWGIALQVFPGSGCTLWGSREFQHPWRPEQFQQFRLSTRKNRSRIRLQKHDIGVCCDGVEWSAKEAPFWADRQS